MISTMLWENRKVLEMNSAAVTDRGQRRHLNEDAVFEQSEPRAGLYLVCDGLGGHQAGEVASQLAIKTVTAELDPLFTKLTSGESYFNNLKEDIETAVIKTNVIVRHYAETHPYHAGDLSTTLTLALIYDDLLYVANVGDSRAYIWREGEVTQLTQDHSLAARLASVGMIDKGQVDNHPYRNMLYRAIGMDDEVTVDIFKWKLEIGDRLLLCSDGLWQAFPDLYDLAWWISQTATPRILCRRLIEEANRRDGSDNISAVVVNINARKV
jgi:protein phosphatase